MISFSRVGKAIGTFFTIIIFLIALSVVWNGWFLPEPQYTVNSYKEIVSQEITLSFISVIFDIVILFPLLYIISFALSYLKNLTFGQRTLLILMICFVFSLIAISSSIVQSLKFWQPLVKSTDTIEQRTFTRTRGGGFGLQKSYMVRFSQQKLDLSVIQKGVVPYLIADGYTANDFGARVGGQEYSDNNAPSIKAIQLKDVRELPFTTPLQKFDYANINFAKKNPSDAINILIDNNEEKNILEGTLTAYH